jgi:hypothetical protein
MASQEGDRPGSSTDVREEERGNDKAEEGLRDSIGQLSKKTNGNGTGADRREDSGAADGPDGAGGAKDPGGEHEGEKAEEWQNTKAARRVSLAKLGLSQNEMRSLSARIKKEEQNEEEGGKPEVVTSERREDSGDVMDKKA